MLSYIVYSAALAVKLAFYAVLSVFFTLLAIIIGLKVIFEPFKGICKCTAKLHGKVVLVTGGNSGIGLETARALARRGARVIIACRNAKKSEEAISDIIKTTGNTQIEYRYLDLSKFSSVRQFAEDFNRAEKRLDILVNNAGVAGAKLKLTEDGIDLAHQINYFGAFLLTNLLLDKLAASKPSRIVVVSSLAHRFCWFDPNDLAFVNSRKSNYFNVYARSKLLQVFWTKALAKRLPLGVTVNVLHPGVVKSDIFHRFPEFYRNLIMFLIDLLFKTSAEGAQTAVHLCVAPELEHASGGYYADCCPRRPRVIVNDERLVERIWNESMALTKSK
ncbi:hypothetical protein O0L34_g3447 [Tuta absoluta]|nr:hypothetical protein O0L34_g3447 [Tuta absoluta]